VELLSILRRRWILACSLFVLTLVGVAFEFVRVPWTYQSMSSVVFLAPTNVAKSYGANPYLAFNATLNQTADVVRYEVNDARTANALIARGDTSTYLVTDAVDTAGPVLIVTVTGSSKAGVESTLAAVTQQITVKLAGLQTTITPPNKIRDLVITFTPEATRVAKKKVKPLLVVFALGLVFTIGVPVIVDAQRSARRKKAEPEEAWEDIYPLGDDRMRHPKNGDPTQVTHRRPDRPSYSPSRQNPRQAREDARGGGAQQADGDARAEAARSGRRNSQREDPQAGILGRRRS
jgi:hypothetical protein